MGQPAPNVPTLPVSTRSSSLPCNNQSLRSHEQTDRFPDPCADYATQVPTCRERAETKQQKREEKEAAKHARKAAQASARIEHDRQKRRDKFAHAAESRQEKEAAQAIDDARKGKRKKEVEKIKSRLSQYLLRRTERKERDKTVAKKSHGFWGFDPSAGLISSAPDGWNQDGGCYVRHQAGESSNIPAHDRERDVLERRTGRIYEKGWRWGVECGGPGKEGLFGHGALKDRQNVTIPVIRYDNYGHKLSRSQTNMRPGKKKGRSSETAQWINRD